MPKAVLFNGVRFHPHRAVSNIGAKLRYIVRKRMECTTAGDIEFGMAPIAGEDAVADHATMKRKSHVRTTIVEGVGGSVVHQDEDGAATGGNDFPGNRI
jgi:hypothetical protein